MVGGGKAIVVTTSPPLKKKGEKKKKKTLRRAHKSVLQPYGEGEGRPCLSVEQLAGKKEKRGEDGDHINCLAREKRVTLISICRREKEGRERERKGGKFHQHQRRKREERKRGGGESLSRLEKRTA